MSRLLYLVNQRIPTEKAYGIQITKMCEAFANTGLDVTLVAPKRGHGQMADIFDYYSVRRNFKIKYLNPPDFYWPGRLDFFAFWIKNLFSAWSLARYAIKQGADALYSRDELPLFFVSLFKPGLKIVFEAHKFSKRKRIFYDRFKKLGIKVIAITNGLADEFLRIGFTRENIKIAPDGVDAKTIEEEASKALSKEEARKKLGLPLDSKMVVYTGGLYHWKGVYVLAEAAKLIPEVNFVLVGGGQGEIELRNYIANNQIKNIKLLGYVRDDARLHLYRSAADVLALPNTSKNKLSEIYTSPLKLFEYMASLRPIVASSLPSIREILNENNAVLVKPDDREALAAGISCALSSGAVSEKMSRNAFESVKKYTWQKRARNIIKDLLPDKH